MRIIKNNLALLLVAVMAISSVMIPAQAAMIQTRELTAQAELEASREKIGQFLARDEVRSQLIKQGISPAEAQARIEALSPFEVAQLAQNIDSMPAGGDVLGVILFLFLVLLFTDIMGFTSIFPFVNPVRN